MHAFDDIVEVCHSGEVRRSVNAELLDTSDNPKTIRDYALHRDTLAQHHQYRERFSSADTLNLAWQAARPGGDNCWLSANPLDLDNSPATSTSTLVRGLGSTRAVDSIRTFRVNIKPAEIDT